MADKLIRAENITKNYPMGDVVVRALRDVSFSVEAGEFIVILGPSGSGKSTLLNILGGMDAPDAGRVVVEGADVAAMDERELTQYRRTKVGFVFQFYNLLPDLTARENIELAWEIAEQPLNIDEVLEAVGLCDRADHFPSQMSGGEQQRVAIARAVAKNPTLLLCDEPTGALDYQTGISILNLLSAVHKRFGTTLLVVTHNAAIGDTADRVLRMRSGHIVEDRKNEHPLSPEDIVW